MKRRILTFSCAIAALAILLTTVLIFFAVYRISSENLRSSVRAVAEYISDTIEIYGADHLDALDVANHRITYIDTDGTVLFDNEVSAASMENHLNRPEVQDALANGYGECTRASVSWGERTFYFAQRTSSGCVLRIAATTDDAATALLSLVPATALIALVVFLVMLATVRQMTGRIVAPINALNLDEPEANETYDELTPLLTRLKLQNDRINEHIAELRHTQIEFHAITDNMREGFIVLGSGAEVLSFNKSALHLLQVEAHDTAALRNVISLNRSDEFRRAVEQSLGGVQSDQMITVASRHIRLTATPITMSDDRGAAVIGAVLVLLDITEREEREELRREFTANVSHELKTPLTAVSGYAEIIANGVARPEDIPRFAGQIYTEAQRMIRLINDIILLSKLDEGKTTPQRELVDLSALCRDIAERLSITAASSNISINVDTDGNNEVSGIRPVLDEMVTNLVDNAIKYNVSGGSVHISTARRGSDIILTVADSGVGIPEAEQERVFERFYRVDKSRNSSIPGTGLGLSIVKRGALLHNARVELSSSSASGTKITLTFKE